MRTILSQFTDDAIAASSTYFKWKSIHTIASEKEEIESLLNEDAGVWNVILHSLQVTHFISIGRIYDIDGEALSIHRLLRECVSRIDEFSLSALRKRKYSGSDSSKPEWLDDYMESAYEPKESDFHRLKSEVAKRQKIYDEQVKPIRHKVYAHTDFNSFPTSHLLFPKAKIAQMEELISFANRLKDVVFELFYNGRLTNIEDHSFEEFETHKSEVRDLLNKIKPNRVAEGI